MLFALRGRVQRERDNSTDTADTATLKPALPANSTARHMEAPSRVLGSALGRHLKLGIRQPDTRRRSPNEVSLRQLERPARKRVEARYLTL